MLLFPWVPHNIRGEEFWRGVWVWHLGLLGVVRLLSQGLGNDVCPEHSNVLAGYGIGDRGVVRGPHVGLWPWEGLLGDGGRREVDGSRLCILITKVSK